VGGGWAAQLPTALTRLLSSVTAPTRPKTAPRFVAFVLRVTLWSASTFPANAVPVPSVAALPTAQNTPQAEPPPVNTTLALLDVIKVLPVWKTHTDPAGPASVSVPVNWAELLKQ
jgi:hypothetical protein